MAPARSGMEMAIRVSEESARSDTNRSLRTQEKHEIKLVPGS
jgi:hypothetical protein